MGIGVWHAIWSVFVVLTVRARYFLCVDSMDLLCKRLEYVSATKFYGKLSPLNHSPGYPPFTNSTWAEKARCKLSLATTCHAHAKAGCDALIG